MRGYSDNFRQRVIDSFKREPEVQAQFTDIEIIVHGSPLRIVSTSSGVTRHPVDPGR